MDARTKKVAVLLRRWEDGRIEAQATPYLGSGADFETAMRELGKQLDAEAHRLGYQDLAFKG